MKQELLSHPVGYLCLILGLSFLSFLFFAAWPNHDWQRVLALVLVLFYFAWGVVTHSLSRQISKQVILEYLAIGSLAGLVLLLITF